MGVGLGPVSVQAGCHWTHQEKKKRKMLVLYVEMASFLCVLHLSLPLRNFNKKAFFFEASHIVGGEQPGFGGLAAAWGYP